MAFEGLTEKLSAAFKKLRGKGRLTEADVKDAMREIAVTKGMTAVEFEGKRYDMGNKFGILQAQIEVGLDHPETAAQLKAYIKDLAKAL